MLRSKSGLSKDLLKRIWSEADHKQRGELGFARSREDGRSDKKGRCLSPGEHTFLSGLPMKAARQLRSRKVAEELSFSKTTSDHRDEGEAARESLFSKTC